MDALQKRRQRRRARWGPEAGDASPSAPEWQAVRTAEPAGPSTGEPCSRSLSVQIPAVRVSRQAYVLVMQMRMRHRLPSGLAPGREGCSLLQSAGGIIPGAYKALTVRRPLYAGGANEVHAAQPAPSPERAAAPDPDDLLPPRKRRRGRTRWGPDDAAAGAGAPFAMIA